MKTSALLLLPVILIFFASAARGQPAFTVISTQRAQITQPAQFWRGGAMVNATDLIIIRANVRTRIEFLPRDISGPLFVFGSTVGLLIRNPFEDGEAIIVVPRAASVQTLWLSGNGVLRRKLVPPLIDQLRQQATSLQRSVSVFPAAGSISTFPNMEQLMRTVVGIVP